jgi:Glycosyltransferase family 87
LSDRGTLALAPGRRWALPPLWVCVAIYAASLLVLLLSHMGHGWPFVDLAVYRSAGQGVLDGARLYDLRFPGALAFTYPPFSALLFTGLTLFRLSVLEPLVTAGSVVLLPVMFGCALRLEPVSTWLPARQVRPLACLAAAGALWLEPVWTTLRYGQVDVLIATLIVFDLSRSDGSRWKGVGIGLAIGLKLTPGIFALYLLLTRRYRAAAISLTVFCATILVGFLALPEDSRAYWGGAFMDPRRVGRIENAANQTLRGAYARLLHTIDVGTPWLLTAIAIGAVGMVLAVIAGRRGDEVRGFSLCALTGLLVSPISWSHHWVLAVPALLLLALDAYRRRGIALLIGCGLAASIAYSHMIWWVPVNHPPHSELHLDALQLVYSDAYVLLGLIALALAVGSSFRWGRAWRIVVSPSP